MNPSIKNFSEHSDVLYFTLHGVEVSIANAIRRTILSDIPTIVIETDTYEKNQCTVLVNTSRLHNEIIKQRLSCIPIHSTLLRDNEDGKSLPGNYELVVDVTNDSDNTIYVTTEDFRLRDKETNTMLSKEEQEKLFPGLFPKNMITQSYIDFARLRAKIGETIEGEQLSLTADFSINTAHSNSMYNVVSKCSYGNTPDVDKAGTVWDDLEGKLRTEGESAEDIKFKKDNFNILDAQRYFIENSFDFVVQTLGVYDNKDIVKLLIDNKAKIVEYVESCIYSKNTLSRYNKFNKVNYNFNWIDPKDGNTILMKYVKCPANENEDELLDLIKYLVKIGVKTDIKNNEGKTAYEIAVNEKVKDYLKKYEK